MFFKHHSANSKEYAALLGIIVVDVERHHSEGFLAAERLPSKRSTRFHTLYDPTRFSFKHLVRQIVPDIVKVDGFDLDVRKEGVLHNGSRETDL